MNSCGRCGREVYFAERKLAIGKVWHSFCFSCYKCRKLLDSCSVCPFEGELFCTSCYRAVCDPCPRPVLHYVRPPSAGSNCSRSSNCSRGSNPYRRCGSLPRRSSRPTSSSQPHRVCCESASPLPRGLRRACVDPCCNAPVNCICCGSGCSNFEVLENCCDSGCQWCPPECCGPDLKAPVPDETTCKPCYVQEVQCQPCCNPACSCCCDREPTLCQRPCVNSYTLRPSKPNKKKCRPVPVSLEDPEPPSDCYRCQCSCGCRQCC